MEIIYYPDLYITSDDLIKSLILFWGKVKTIIPSSIMEYNKSYLSGDIKNEKNFPLENYKIIRDKMGENVIDFLVISEEERKRASVKMLAMLSEWNKNTHFFDSLKIHSMNDLIGKTFEWFWFLNEKLERPLVELMLEEKLVVNWAPGEIVGFQEIGKSYMSIIADDIKNNRGARIITDDEYYLGAKTGTMLERNINPGESYQLVSLAIPQLYIDNSILKQMKWKDIKQIRNDLNALIETYYSEIEEFQNKINVLVALGNSDEAFNVFCNFCDRVAISFKPLVRESRKILKLLTDPKKIGIFNSILLPTVRLLSDNHDLKQFCDVLSISSTINSYSAPSNIQVKGFEYLEKLNRKIEIAKFKNTISLLIPKGIKDSLR